MIPVLDSYEHGVLCMNAIIMSRLVRKEVVNPSQSKILCFKCGEFKYGRKGTGWDTQSRTRPRNSGGPYLMHHAWSGMRPIRRTRRSPQISRRPKGFSFKDAQAN
ncbi:hypothetical protein CEXT_221411 [Caerostris extrusa]|uniref:Ribosomal protein L2 n=1 Tax=Caerostris extrusa TaxID=172846 RepID=A0AAV4Y3K7_CAEEX|nr:hypothetical protein CEXT_221411 [Caerostris extrusa]